MTQNNMMNSQSLSRSQQLSRDNSGDIGNRQSNQLLHLDSQRKQTSPNAPKIMIESKSNSQRKKVSQNEFKDLVDILIQNQSSKKLNENAIEKPVQKQEIRTKDEEIEQLMDQTESEYYVEDTSEDESSSAEDNAKNLHLEVIEEQLPSQQNSPNQRKE